MSHTIGRAIDRLSPDQMVEFWKELTRGIKESDMEEQEVWDEIQEAAKKLNHYMRLAVSKGMRVECDVNDNLREVQWKHVIPRVEVAVYKEMKDPRHTHV